MYFQSCRMMCVCCASLLLHLSPVVLAQNSAVHEAPPPATFPEVYDQMGECMTYFSFMYEDLEKAGAPQAELDRYNEMAGGFSLLHPSISNRLTSKERRKALTPREARRRMKNFDDQESMRNAYEARCVALHDKFDEYVAAIERRLELASGEPYVNLKNTCVTISTDWLTLTGLYKGMVGPSVKPVPKGGFKPIDFGSGDRYKIALAVGSEEYWSTVEIPPPPAAHIELLAMPVEEQARLLAEPLANYRVSCKQPRNPFFRGLDARGMAYWAVACEDGSAFSIRISDEHGISTHYNCDSKGGYEQPECFEPCSRYGCYSLEPGISGTDEYVPYAKSVRVEKAPAGACPEKYSGGYVTQNRGKLPALGAGERHRLSMAIIEPACCNALDQPGNRTLDIYATWELNLLKIDLATLEAPPLRLDRSSGPPCEVLHINANVDQLADLRCRLTGDPDEVRQSNPTLTVRGQFTNGDPFEGQVEVCIRPDNRTGE